MSELVRIDDTVAASKQLLMTMYQGRAGVEGLIAAFAAHNQRIEDQLFALASGRLLVTPTTAGQTLDNIGDLVGVGRNGLPDEDFRLLIKAKVAENNADGTLPTLLRVVQQLFASTAVFEKSPNTFARSGQGRGGWLALMVGTPGIPERLYPLVIRLIRQSLPAGVELAHLGTFRAAGALACDGPQPWVGGLGDVNDPAVGAPMASILNSSGY